MGVSAPHEAVSGSVLASEQFSIIRCLLDGGANINIPSRRLDPIGGENGESQLTYDGPYAETPLQMAVRRPDLMKLLIERGADLDIENSDGYAAFDVALCLSEDESANLLIESRADHMEIPTDSDYQSSYDE